MTATVGGAPIPAVPDLRRMRSARHAKLQLQLEAEGLDGLMLLGTNAVTYATGASAPGMDAGRAALCRPVVIVVRGTPVPHLFTPFGEGAPPEMPPDHVHPALYPDLDESGPWLARALADHFGPGARVGIDELTHPMLADLQAIDVVSAASVLGAVKLCKTPDELACIRAAQHINELAMRGVQPLVRPGARQVDLTGAFLRRIFELGATSNAIDPIWQPMPASKALGPWTTHGDVAFPTPSTDAFLRDGDVVWIDTGVSFEGYASDFGRTWIVAHHPRPTPRQRSQYQRWHHVVEAVRERCRPGVSALDLDRAAVAANNGSRPWLEHFYLAHGVGTDSAEMPLVGTDLGEAFDEALTILPGMVLVLEPVIWDDGAAGYRSEDMLAITDDGWVPLSDYPYDPYEAAG